jgi:hypothetical protein
MDHYSVAGLEFAVRSTDARLFELLQRYLRGFHLQEGSDDILFSADCGVERRVAGRAQVTSLKRLFFGSTLIYRGRSLHELAARLISGIRDWTNDQSNEFFRVRAGAVAIEGHALLLPSAPSIDLAALVGSLVRGGGIGYIGDEIANVDPILGQAHGVGLPLLIDGGRMSLFPEIPADPSPPRRRRGQEAPVQARPRWPVLLEEIGGNAAPPTEIRWIVFPEFKQGESTRLEPIAKAEAVFRLSEAALNMHIWTDRALTLMRRLVDEHVVGRLTIGDLQEGADWLARMPTRIGGAEEG